MHIALIPTIGLIIIVCIIWGLITYLPAPPLLKYIAYAVIAVLAILWVADTFGVVSLGGHVSMN